ncbi:MAG: hypothetical protein ACRDLR_07800, partial [Gaiellaceae bacterium]
MHAKAGLAGLTAQRLGEPRACAIPKLPFESRLEDPLPELVAYTEGARSVQALRVRADLELATVVTVSNAVVTSETHQDRTAIVQRPESAQGELMDVK